MKNSLLRINYKENVGKQSQNKQIPNTQVNISLLGKSKRLEFGLIRIIFTLPKLNTIILQLIWKCTRHVIYARPCVYLTNRLNVAECLFSNRSQMTSKSPSCATYLVRSKLVAHEAIAEWVTDVLTTFKHLLWSITEQTHGNMGSICFI